MTLGGKGHTHRFDPDSGWCAYCNLRDDGRLIGLGGAVWQPGRPAFDPNATEDQT